MKQIQECEGGQQAPEKRRKRLESGYEWLKADREKQQLSERRRRKLEKKKRKQQQKRRKRINARIDRTVSLLAVALCVAASVLDVQRRRGKLPFAKK